MIRLQNTSESLISSCRKGYFLLLIKLLLFSAPEKNFCAPNISQLSKWQSIFLYSFTCLWLRILTSCPHWFRTPWERHNVFFLCLYFLLRTVLKYIKFVLNFMMLLTFPLLPIDGWTLLHLKCVFFLLLFVCFLFLFMCSIKKKIQVSTSMASYICVEFSYCTFTSSRMNCASLGKIEVMVPRGLELSPAQLRACESKTWREASSLPTSTLLLKMPGVPLGIPDTRAACSCSPSQWVLTRPPHSGFCHPVPLRSWPAFEIHFSSAACQVYQAKSSVKWGHRQDARSRAQSQNPTDWGVEAPNINQFGRHGGSGEGSLLRAPWGVLALTCGCLSSGGMLWTCPSLGGNSCLPERNLGVFLPPPPFECNLLFHILLSPLTRQHSCSQI